MLLRFIVVGTSVDLLVFLSPIFCFWKFLIEVKLVAIYLAVTELKTGILLRIVLLNTQFVLFFVFF